MRDDGATSARPRPGHLLLLWLALAALVPLTTLLAVRRAAGPTPYADQWGELLRLLSVQSGAAPWTRLLQPHNEHPILVPRLFFAADLFLFRARSTFLFLSIAVLQALGIAQLVRETRTAEGLTPGGRAFLAGCYVALLGSAAQMENLTWGFQVTFVLVLCAAVAALRWTLAARAREGPARTRTFIAAMGAGLVATFSMANGVLVWPLLVPAVLVVRPRARLLAPVAACGALAVALWLWVLGGLPGGAGDAPPSAAAVGTFVAMYLAAPVRFFGPDATALTGALGLGAALLVTAASARRAVAGDRFRAVHLLILWFVLGGALATALGRGRASPDVALNGRYATAALYAWAALLSLAAVELVDRTSTRKVPAVGAVVLALGLLALLPLVQRAGAREAVRWRREVELAELAVVVGVPDGYTGLLYPDPGPVRPIVQALRERRLATFTEDWAHAVGRPLRELGPMEAPWSDGGFAATTNVVTRLQTIDPTLGARAYGRAPAAAAFVFLADDAGVVRGIARPTRGAAVPRWPQSAAGSGGGTRPWFGFATSTAPEILTAYATDGPGDSLHPLPGDQFAGDLTRLRSPVVRSAWDPRGGWGPAERAACGDPFPYGYAFTRCEGAGALTSEPFATDGATYLIVPVLVTDPRTAVALAIVDGATGERVAALDAAGRPLVWSPWTVAVGERWPPTVRIVVRPGSSPGAVSVGEPRLYAAPAGAVSSD